MHNYPMILGLQQTNASQTWKLYHGFPNFEYSCIFCGPEWSHVNYQRDASYVVDEITMTEIQESISIL